MVKFDEIYTELEQDVKEVQVGDLKFNVKQYLPLREKFHLIMTIINGSFSDSGYKGLLSYIAYNVNMIDFYCDIDLDSEESLFEILDYLDERGITEVILNSIPETEKDFIERVLLEDLEERKKKEDSLIGNIMPSLKTLIKEINGLDSDVIEKMQSIMSSTDLK